jgi:pimeloyl-ACP methyl ester carboxylesterase
MLVLHGKFGGANAALRELHLDRYVARAVRRGMHPYAVASIDGGENRYWHKHAGDNPAGTVLHEFLPLLDRKGLRTDKVALFGWSMGGYGALHIAQLLGPRRVASVGVEAPAIWQSYAETEPGAFDDAADFWRNSVFRRLDRLQGVPVRISLGSEDRFRYAVFRLRDELRPSPVFDLVPGYKHEVPLFLTAAPAQVAFAGEHLAP